MRDPGSNQTGSGKIAMGPREFWMRLKFGAETDAGQHNEVANAAGAFLEAELCRVEH